MNLPGPGINDDDGAALGILTEDFLTDALEILINGCDHIITGNWRLGDALRCLVTIGVVGEVEAARTAFELIVEGLFDSLTPFALREDQVIILNWADRERRNFAGISNDVRGEFTVGIDTRIDLLENQGTGEATTCSGEFLGLEILNQGQW